MSDYISRDEIFSVWRSMPKPASISSLTDAINRTPAADVEPVRYGEWRLVRRMAACGEYECSVCGRIETFGCFNKPENNPYCHCGAKMKLEGNDEN